MSRNPDGQENHACFVFVVFFTRDLPHIFLHGDLILHKSFR